MPSWFKKVFKDDAAKPKSDYPSGQSDARPVARVPSLDNPALGKPDTSSHDRPAVRKVVNAPVLMPEEEQSGWSEDVRIKARVEKDMTSCVFMVDRPVLEGASVFLPGAEWAPEVSPLAAALFTVAGVGSVLLHDFTVTIALGHGNTRPWQDLCAEVGAVIREHLKEGRPVVTEAFTEALPPEAEIRKRVQGCIDLEINPGIAAHSGSVTLERVTRNTVYLSMGGGCQGCAASSITLRQGIHTAFRRAVPQIGAIYDETDHTAGKNPFFKELPVGMA